jgi:hypothetical protein
MIAKIIYYTIFLVALKGALQELKLFDDPRIAEVQCADTTYEVSLQFK